MVNQELIDLCRLMVAVVKESDNFTTPQLRAMLMNVVPRLLAELDILSAVLEMLRPQPKNEAESKVIDAVAEIAEDLQAIAPPAKASRRQKKPVSKKKPKKGARR